MEFGSILDLRESPDRENASPAFLQDLNLDQIIERIGLYWGESVAVLYAYLPADEDCGDYRREVYGDIAGQEILYSLLCEFVENMRRRKEAASWKHKVESGLQKAVWHVREAGYYCTAARDLVQGLAGIRVQSRGMRSFAAWLEQYLASEAFGKICRETDRLLGVMQGFRMKLVYENERIAVSLEDVPGTYDHFLKSGFPGREREMKSPFETTPELTDLEQELLKAFRRKYPDFFREAESFYKECFLYAEEKLLRFDREICYYLSFCRFEEKMKGRGFAFATPAESGKKEMYARGLYDLALACGGGMIPGKVRANDMAYGPGEQFFVLTGQNQGGKTTFARSLGQLVYFARMGLDVPALEACVPYFPDICTHFSVEESVETGKGKLVEELTRLAPMMDTGPRARRGTFVILNELFTTAANYDACIMGKRVLEHFMAMDCRGIYVTHLRELTEGDPGIVSLRALTDDGGEPTYEIARGEAPELAGAVHLVEKHRLTYGQIRERLRDGTAGLEESRGEMPGEGGIS